MFDDAYDVSHRLADNAEVVCRHYLPAGRREGAYWRVGDVHNAPGRSLSVRLAPSTSGNGVAGRWTDRATFEHGDLLDIIRERRGLSSFADVLDEARAFLALPRSKLDSTRASRREADQYDRRKAVLHIIARTFPLAGSIAETYLRYRGLDRLSNCDALRFHPLCTCRCDGRQPWQRRPALVAIVTDLAGTTVGVHRTYLADDGTAKAPIGAPRRSLGPILGHGVRFGLPADVLAAGEGIETTLSLKLALPTMPMVAALSASNLAALLLHANLKRLYVARDADEAGDRATAALCQRARRQGVDAIVLNPEFGDFNDDLRAIGLAVLRAKIADQLAPEDVVRLIADPTSGR
jgi:Toprim domain